MTSKFFRYSLAKSRRIMRQAMVAYKKKGSRLNSHDRHTFEKQLEALDSALLAKNRKEADVHARKVELFLKTHFPKSLWEQMKELVYALVFAIVVAFLIRQFWFELYEVPTGSMRPTIGELDRLVVSKSTFGINPPFKNDLWLYKNDYLKRGGTIVFTVEDMDVADADTVYFYLFPGKKRYVKRLMGKPGDTLYFYGGKIYGIDSAGKPFDTLYDDASLKRIGIEKIDHVPVITFDGKVSVDQPHFQGFYASTLIRQMNIPVGKLDVKKDGRVEGLFFNGKEWLKDNPAALKAPHDAPESYSDLWGIKNYAAARLLTPKQKENFYGSSSTTDGVLYLELQHTPNLTYPHPVIRRGETGKAHPLITPYISLIPLQQQHLSALQEALYTARFIVKDGHAFRYQEGRRRPQRADFDPLFSGVPDGTYEFYYGQGYKIHWGGIRTKLAPNHPLYAKTAENIQKLFNLGIGFNLVFAPMAPYQPFNPQRFAYYRDGDLYVMGAPILKKEDETLRAFVAAELKKQEKSSESEPYIAFVDAGPPLKEGKVDVDFIRAFGLKIPEDGVLALGDNYAMSADSRDFGFVPTRNLRGAPSFTFWPPGTRLGPLPQNSYAWFTLPNILIWSAVIVILIVCYLFLRKRNQKPLFKKIEL